MKTTLAITGCDVITFPTRFRKALGLSAADQLIAETTLESILLRPAITLPIELYSDERLREFEEAEAELFTVLDKKTKSHQRSADIFGRKLGGVSNTRSNTQAVRLPYPQGTGN